VFLIQLRQPRRQPRRGQPQRQGDIGYRLLGLGAGCRQHQAACIFAILAQLLHQARLTNTWLAGEYDELGVACHGARPTAHQLAPIRRAPDQCAGPRRWRCLDTFGGGFLQQTPVQRLDGRPRLDAQLFDQQSGAVGVNLECMRAVADGDIQAHQQQVRAFAQPVGAQQQLGVANGVAHLARRFEQFCQP
jgi:hypothetical protein